MTSIRRLTICTVLISVLCPAPASGHEVRPALLEVVERAPNEYLIRWKVPALGDRRVAIEPIFETQCEADSQRIETNAGDAAFSRWHIRCSNGIENSTIRFERLSSTMIDVLVRVDFLDGRTHIARVTPNDPTCIIPGREANSLIFGSYVQLGVWHIAAGWDHLLFVLGMMLLVPDIRRLIWAITGFTVAHSITLGLAALEIVHVPGPPVEAIIALSIVVLAAETLNYRKSQVETLSIRAPWIVSAAIGLVHGLGFAGALSEYGLPAYARLTALFAFNVGVELGQLVVVGVVLTVLAAFRRIGSNAEETLRYAAAWGIGICGAFWLVERLIGFGA